MTINPFKLERFFAKYEFKARYLVSPSDCESLGMAELLQLADTETRYLWDNLHLGYTESQGNPLLRAEIASLYPGIASNEIVVAVPEEAIFIAMHSLLKPGDQVVAISPAYQSLYELALSIGCEVSRWEMKLQENCWQADFNSLEQAITPRTKLLVINFPHNPTGFLPAFQDLEQIVNLARSHNLYLLSDEMNRQLEYNPNDRLPAVCTLYEKGISLSGLSKSLALPGLRLGWLVTHDQSAMETFQVFKDYTTICSSAPSEILGIIALRAKETILKRNLGIIKNNLEFSKNFFTNFSEFVTWLAPMAGSVAFPLWEGDLPVEVFCRHILDEKGIMIVPGEIFNHKGNHFRIGLGRKDLPEALNEVGDYLKIM